MAEAAPVATKVCRAISVTGGASWETGGKLAGGDVIENSAWLTLAPGARVAVKHAETSREVVFIGPTRVVACDHGEERFLMTLGHAVTSTQAGARPGAEVLIATPLGVVRYGDAALDVVLDEKSLRVKATTGDAFLDDGQSRDPAGRGPEVVSPGHPATRKGTTVDVKALVAICELSARGAEESARDVLMPGPHPAPLGDRAASHVRHRKTARVDCALAAAAVGTVTNAEDRRGLAETVAHAEVLWRGVPSGTRSGSSPGE